MGCGPVGVCYVIKCGRHLGSNLGFHQNLKEREKIDLFAKH